MCILKAYTQKCVKTQKKGRYKKMINFIRENKKALALLTACVAALVAVNAYTLHITRGCYNIFDFIF